ncbi:hypothetical protein B4O97_09110 [Marispirochaeta aestuarii]|uniref:Uncharacterized protein n=1 Tax=Marispirochaeta aestuarii TaxID=1963862 RepID=A0A1Y1RZ64_9SPIO|nr:hypothetical protein [Marispirochaeta aestuarii]ORC35324.1 hypothetical protein B4O97_09110 [Marispirochaeta aestuarii]
MKQTQQMKRAQANMAPGVLTLEGFLGRDQRHLLDIIIEDEAAVQRLDVSHEAIANRMQFLRDGGAKGLGEFVTVEPGILVRVDSVRGKLPCPFEDQGLFEKTTTTVRNEKHGREISYSDLHIHLIREHGFYEGKGFAFRLDPEALVEVLEVSREEA